MTTIRKAVREDFELVYPLLEEFNSRYLHRQDWEKLFYQNWDAKQGYCGYIMLDHEKAVGFLGLLFKNRNIKGKNYNFCNLTSWIVKEKYRSKSIFMLQPVLKLKSFILTDLTPSQEVHNLLKRAGFLPLESHYRFIFPFFRPLKIKSNISFITDKKSVEEKLNKSERQIFCDHQFDYCHHVVLQSSQGECYLVLTRMVRKRAPFLMARIHYVSNPEFFREYISLFRFWVCTQYRVLAMVIDERFMEGKKIIFSQKLRLKNKALFRSSVLSKYDIDNLYSELVLFNI
ncbi:MAG: hypothetical protein P8078_02410 [bacterium]